MELQLSFEVGAFQPIALTEDRAGFFSGSECRLLATGWCYGAERLQLMVEMLEWHHVNAYWMSSAQYLYSSQLLELVRVSCYSSSYEAACRIKWRRCLDLLETRYRLHSRIGSSGGSGLRGLWVVAEDGAREVDGYTSEAFPKLAWIWGANGIERLVSPHWAFDRITALANGPLELRVQEVTRHIGTLRLQLTRAEGELQALEELRPKMGQPEPEPLPEPRKTVFEHLRDRS
jgi:hypothetical protein